VKILHLPTNVANQGYYLVRALRALGHEADVWQYATSRFGFPADRMIDLSRKDARVVWELLLEALANYDVFHFHYARSFMYSGWGGVPFFWDLPVLRMLGKRIYVSFHGSDCRMRSVHERINPWANLLFEHYQPDDARIEKTIGIWRTYADGLIVHAPELLSYVPGATLVNRVIDLDAWPEQAPADNHRPICLHAPSRRETKGTDLILRGMEQLESEGVSFELRLIENASHDEVRHAMAGADVLIDQILIGDHGVASMEAMASGRVAVAYLLDGVQRAYADSPVYNVNPDSFVDRMRVLLSDAAVRRERAARGRAFVEAHFEPSAAAQQLASLYAREPRPATEQAFPGWVEFGDDRTLEQSTEQVLALAETAGRERTLAEQANAELRAVLERVARERAARERAARERAARERAARERAASTLGGRARRAVRKVRSVVGG
jgi:glycosyltransferase involved in cell wall biosynthesis